MRGYRDGLLMHINKERSRMWALMLFLYILGLNSCQVTGQDRSTQMYYVVLNMEKSAIANVSKILDTFTATNSSAEVKQLKMTTTCERIQNENQCTCESNHLWSEEVCKPRKCCESKTCNFPNKSPPICYPDTRVTVTGEVSLAGIEYHDCLKGKTSDEFKNCHDALVLKMKTVYSTLIGFDSLIIKDFRLDEVIIANFEVNVNSFESMGDLPEKSVQLSNTLNSSFSMETQGLIHISMPSGPVRYKSDTTVSCTPQVDLRSDPKWHLTKKGKDFDITNGTESQLVSKGNSSVINLQHLTEIWAGVFTCSYRKTLDLVTITHRAQAALDVALLPQIRIFSTPQFPHCTKGKEQLQLVTVTCEIQSSHETYEVTWQGENLKSEIKNNSDSNIVHTGITTVGCDPDQSSPNITCNFTNRLGQSKEERLTMVIIYENDEFCKAENDWEDTKVGYEAVLMCEHGAGDKRRRCSTGGRWEDEESNCVNQDLHSILQDADIVDVGLGTLDNNAANVFSRLKNATNDKESINTFSNVNASVEVLVSMDKKLKQLNNESSLDDLLTSSSTLLDDSLQKSWRSAKDKDSNLTLGERYLSSVEKLIEKTNIEGEVKDVPNIEVKSCISSPGSRCQNKVFNVTVSVEGSDPGSVKTTGFKQLVNYLPNGEGNYEPSTIVVSTTIERKRLAPIVKIDFELLKARPHHHEMRCVFWNENSREWSTDGCRWAGAGNEGRCECEHLSSFAVLVSKFPLEVKFADQITYAGLAVSIISLIVSLVIEMLVWSSVVKTNSLYLRHTAHVNISLSLLIADSAFLASAFPKKISANWCQIFVVLKHFFYLSMFFWTLCLSMTLLHQTVFPLHFLSKKKYLALSFLLGYVCPFLIVAITFITNASGGEGAYYNPKTCWLMYTGSLKGSIHTVVIPLGIIVIVNMFSMLLVIVTLLEPRKNTSGNVQREQNATKVILRTVVLFTPIFGVTWIFGYAVMAVDLTSGALAYAVNYAFVIMNAFQGFFILLTTCLGEKMVRDALLKRITKKGQSTTNVSSTSSSVSWKKK